MSLMSTYDQSVLDRAIRHFRAVRYIQVFQRRTSREQIRQAYVMQIILASSVLRYKVQFQADLFPFSEKMYPHLIC